MDQVKPYSDEIYPPAKHEIPYFSLVKAKKMSKHQHIKRDYRPRILYFEFSDLLILGQVYDLGQILQLFRSNSLFGLLKVMQRSTVFCEYLQWKVIATLLMQ